jgi:DNA-binding Lrp family transcriptional regulator
MSEKQKIYAEFGGFTPIIDSLVQKYGIVTAAVFGRVWRYCTLQSGFCTASIETIANDLRLNYGTVLRHIKVLVRDGYLEDMTPDVRNHAHKYIYTGKAGLQIEVNAYDDKLIEDDEGEEVALKARPVALKARVGSRLKRDEETETIKETQNSLFDCINDNPPMHQESPESELSAEGAGGDLFERVFAELYQTAAPIDQYERMRAAGMESEYLDALLFYRQEQKREWNARTEAHVEKQTREWNPERAWTLDDLAGYLDVPTQAQIEAYNEAMRQIEGRNLFDY